MKKNNKLSKRHSDAIKIFSEKAKKLLNDNLVDILIYGSAPRGESTKDSDIDIIVIVKKNAYKNQMKLAEISFDILMETGEYISLQTMKSKDFKRDTIFLHNVRKEAIHAI